VTVEGTAELAGPDDPHPDVAPAGGGWTVEVTSGGDNDEGISMLSEESPVADGVRRPRRIPP